MNHFTLRNPALTISMDADHRYFVDWGAGEVVLPSVSKIITPIRDFSRIPPAVLERAAEHGKYVHSLTEIMDGGKGGSGLDIGTVLPFYRRYVEPWEKFKRLHDLEPVLVEHLVAHRLRYGGTLDRVFWCGKDDCFYVADITTSTNTASKFVQMAGYKAALLDMMQAESEEAKRCPIHLMTIQADNGGKFTREVMLHEDSVASWVTFMSCLNIHQWREKNDNGR